MCVVVMSMLFRACHLHDDWVSSEYLHSGESDFGAGDAVATHIWEYLKSSTNNSAFCHHVRWVYLYMRRVLPVHFFRPMPTTNRNQCSWSIGIGISNFMRPHPRSRYMFEIAKRVWKVSRIGISQGRRHHARWPPHVSKVFRTKHTNWIKITLIRRLQCENYARKNKPHKAKVTTRSKQPEIK